MTTSPRSGSSPGSTPSPRFTPYSPSSLTANPSPRKISTSGPSTAFVTGRCARTPSPSPPPLTLIPPAPGPASTPGLTDKLVQWLALRFAATAYTLAPVDDEPETELRRLRNLTADIVALRRGDLFSRRIALEEKRLALLVAESDQQREDEFWEWTERPEIRKELQEQLAKELQEKRAWHKTLRAMVPEITPYLLKESSDRPDLPPESDSPAALI